MMNEKRKIVLSFILGFVLCGALIFTGTHFFRHYGGGRKHFFEKHQNENRSKWFLEKFNRKLNLDAEQKTQIDKILQTELQKMNDLRVSMKPEFEKIRASIETQIRAVLKPEQQEKFNTMVEKFEKRRKERGQW